MGVTGKDQVGENQARINLTISSNHTLQEQIETFWKTESFGCTHDSRLATSIEHRRALVILNSTTKFVDGHYEVGMLWRDPASQLPDNRSVAWRRFNSLNKRLCHDKAYQALYSETLNGYIEKRYAKALLQHEVEHMSPKTWYIPHHGVVSPNKPGKLRVVFDAAAVCDGTSLNDNLMSGPDLLLLVSLFGVLQRFRLGAITLMADIESMFHQVCVAKEDTDALRFLWKIESGQPGSPSVYKMMVHIFGAADSPCCANYALRRTALDNRDTCSSLATQSVLQNFYVDDLLTSVETPNVAISLYKELSELLAKGGFHLHKWTSNSTLVMQSIPQSERTIQDVSLAINQLTIQRALGLHWTKQSLKTVSSLILL